MSDSPGNAGRDDERSPDFFDQLIETTPRDQQGAFTVGFRGYDKAEVDSALAALRNQLKQAAADVAEAQAREEEAVETVREEERKAREALESELAAANAKASDAEQQVATLTSELVDTPQPDGEEAPSRQQFEAILRVAEEQANVLIQNAAVQADRLMTSAREEVTAQRAEAEADAERIKEQAQRDADQVRLKMDTEYTAHEARIEREAAHAAEKVNQAAQEATAIRTEAEKGAAALRSLVTRETTQLRADAERDVRDMNARVLEFEETLTRRQDDAQQEFLVLHNQAVAHAERITNDANEQVSASLEHAQRISARAEDYERLTRSQAQAIEADAQVRARETLERARAKAQKIVDSVTGHTTAVLHDAEDRTRQLRWQQQQLSSFMAEVRELIRPDGIFSDDALPTEITGADAPGAAPAEAVADEAPEETFLGDEVLEDELDDSPLEKITIDVVETKKKSSK
ncbi:cell division initiation protein [Microbacterium sp. KSW4-16]|uniref:Cell division initiation protein n=1 Tax=Microbacterium aurugineum TaxID=2851642 RepID=A0ABY4J4N1_9MICO|nr:MULTISPECIES: cell division initiation protein [Microbacterium]MCK8467164.1 cell division initiation protein [Microbacterium aurugineum]MCZ4300099.1 cell division initiation protein [Microbacterium oxydans]TCJ22795.1 cell division initiation protein [Microbacterium sp. PI-1]UPL18823.1 cell division initiation protein [Microbacterium aurugineum]